MIGIPRPGKYWDNWMKESLYRMGLKKRPPAAPEKPAFERRQERERAERAAREKDA